jgi:hypothetical protein
MSGQALTDTSDMVAVHRVFRNELGLAPARVSGLSGDADRRAMLANYYDNILAFLQVHHEGEEEILFPLLEERAPEDTAAVRRAASQHHEVLTLLGSAKDSVLGWSEKGSIADSAIGDSLDALCAELVPHLDEEEETICPLAAAHVSAEEWGRLPQHGMAAFSGDKIWLILGLILEQLSAEQRAHVLAHLPPPAVEMWSGFGENAFTELVGEVRRGS